MVAQTLRFAFLLLSLAATQNCLADTSTRYFTVAAGHVGVLDSDIDNPGVLKIEYRFRPRGKWLLAPAMGAARSENGASFVFTDLERDFYPGRHWVVTGSFGLGSFDDGEDVRLGHSLEFRSGIKIAYQFENHWRLGVGLFHLSNGGLGDRNPGTEPIFLSLSIPL
jgi:lipid A 3-O-deacylase